MRLYLTPEPSLNLTRFLRSTNGNDGLAGTPVRKRTLKDAINTNHSLDSLDESAQRLLDHAGAPIHAYVPERSKGTSTKRLVSHVFGGNVPYGSFLDIGHNICICTPMHAFLGVSAKAELLDAIRIGMELCGTYSQWRLEPNIMGDPYYLERKETRACTFDVPPVMRTKNALAFADRLSGIRGSAGAKRALKWVLDNSASPMETVIYLLLCLPKRLGGYGLPKPTLNPKITISNPDGVKERYPDLFWLGKNIDVEYNSDSAHSGEWSRYRDSKREIELTVANVKVLPLTRPQLMNVDEFDAFAQGLRKMLGVRARGVDDGWVHRRAYLRRELLSEWS